MSKTNELVEQYTQLLAATRANLNELIEGLPGRIRTNPAPGSPHVLYVDPARRTIATAGGNGDEFDIDDLPFESLLSLSRLLQDEVYVLDERTN